MNIYNSYRYAVFEYFIQNVKITLGVQYIRRVGTKIMNYWRKVYTINGHATTTDCHQV
uniref:Uncharacterized protein n=1 Tax=Anguilla anguilla TaxID=7936 RepID=A0A0E9WSR0_ANGAN